MEKILLKIFNLLLDKLGYEVNHTVEIVDKNKEVESNCLAISFLIKGDVNANVNQIPLEVGDAMLSFSTNYPGIDRTRYKIAFDAGVPGVKQIYVIRQVIIKKKC